MNYEKQSPICKAARAQNDAQNLSPHRPLALYHESRREGCPLFGDAHFRGAGKIFATLALEHQGYGVLLLTPDRQAGMIQVRPTRSLQLQYPRRLGEKGATRGPLAKVRRRSSSSKPPSA